MRIDAELPVRMAGILVELPLAPFFLKKFRGAYCDINDLPTLDPQLHR
jgi:ubiquitin-protein ligase E3 C